MKIFPKVLAMAAASLFSLNGLTQPASQDVEPRQAAEPDAFAKQLESSSPLAGWSVGFSPYSWHFHAARQTHPWEPAEQKHSHVWMLQLEKQWDTHQLAGFSLFNNSFGQLSQYLYYGWQFRPLDSAPQWYIKLTGGVIHGYKYPYHKKIPLNNDNGWGLTFIPAIGYDFNAHWSAQANILAKNGLMFQLNYRFR